MGDFVWNIIMGKLTTNNRIKGTYLSRGWRICLLIIMVNIL